MGFVYSATKVQLPLSHHSNHHNDDGKKEEEDRDPVDPVHILHEIRIRPVGILLPEV